MELNYQCKLGDDSKPYWLRQISPQDRCRLNEYLKKSDLGNVFQSYEWGELKQVYGWKPIYLVLEHRDSFLGAVTILKRKAAGMTFFYSPRGPVIDYQNRPELLALFCQGIAGLAAKEGAIFWRMDPELPITSKCEAFIDQKLHPVPVNHPFGGIQPRWVWRIPIHGDLDQQWRSLRKGARQEIKKAQNAGVKIQNGTREDIPVCYQLLQETAGRNNFLLRSRDYYENLWDKLSSYTDFRIFLAFEGRNPMATAIAVGFGRGVWDIYAGNIYTHPDNGASYLLTWEMIAWASAQGYTFCDLGGIAPKTNQTLVGLRTFKSRFGGSELEYIGEYDLIFDPICYRLWNWGERGFQCITTLKKLLRSASSSRT